LYAFTYAVDEEDRERGERHAEGHHDEQHAARASAVAKRIRNNRVGCRHGL
jgi:hypothetical protein